MSTSDRDLRVVIVGAGPGGICMAIRLGQAGFDDVTMLELEKKGFRLGYITKQGIFDNGRSKVAYLEPADTDGHLIELVEPTV